MTAEQFIRWYAKWYATATNEEVTDTLERVDSEDREKLRRAIRRLALAAGATA